MRNSFVSPAMFDRKQALIAVRTVTFPYTASANLIFDHNFGYAPTADVYFYNPDSGYIFEYRQLGFGGSSIDTLLADYQFNFYVTNTQLVLTVRTYQGTLVSFTNTSLMLVIYK